MLSASPVSNETAPLPQELQMWCYEQSGLYLLSHTRAIASKRTLSGL